MNVGDTVVAGQPIGEVGSSGNSTDAHLHFAVYEYGNLVETYLDPEPWWIDPVPYSGDVAGALDHGVINYVPTTEDLVERPVQYDLFQQVDGPGQAARLWTNLHGVDAGDDIDAYFYRPNGTEFAHWHWTSDGFRYGWWYTGIGLPNLPDLGKWQIDFRLNDETIVEDSFLVVTIMGDANADGKVDGIDYLTWAMNYGNDPANDPPGPPVNGDLNFDGVVSGLDYLTWAANYGAGPNDALSVPEPSATSLLLVGLALILVHSRRCH